MLICYTKEKSKFITTMYNTQVEYFVKNIFLQNKYCIIRK